MSRRPGDRIIYHEKRRSAPTTPGRGPNLLARITLLRVDGEQPSAPPLLLYSATAVAVLLITAILWPVRQHIGLLNIGFIYLAAVIGVTITAGRGEGLFASLLGFLLFDFFLVPPYLTFVVMDVQNILALIVFLGVSLLISWLLSTAREQARHAQRRAEDVSRLYELSQAIIGAQRIDEVLPAIAEKVQDVFEAQACWILLPDKHQQLVVRARAPHDARTLGRDEMSLANWAFWHGSEIKQGGYGTQGLQGKQGEQEEQGGGVSKGMRGQNENKRAAFVPLRAGGRTIGVLAVADKKNNRPFTQAERTVLVTFADQAAVALERLYLLKEAQRAEVLARTDELKSALMSAVSHDLRTPLASIMASVTGLLEPGMDWDEDTQREFLLGIYDEATRLNRLVGNLLDMSRIEGGALHPEKDWYSIGEVIGAVVQRLEPQLSKHPTTVDIQKDLPLLLLDYSEIDQVLTNLIENSIKYTPTGTSIDVKARRVDNVIEVSVDDNGPGVPPEHIRHLFDKFYRVDKRSEARGTGLGLAITKGFVEAHGGRIWAENKPGGGLKVTFTMPTTGSSPTSISQLPALVGDRVGT